jgi:Zn-dependent peptidase ImmA (M78 family)
MTDDVLRVARATARTMHCRFGVERAAHIQVEAWATKHGIELIESPLDGAKAQLVRVGERTQIVLPEHVTDRGTRRFSIAHELFHYLMKHPSPTPTMMCVPKALRRNDRTAHAYESSANAFAGELLLPEFLLRARCEVSPVSLDIAHGIAAEFDTSILSSAIRFVELSSERCAAVFAARGEIVWAAPSATFKASLPRGKRLDAGCVAWDFHAGRRLDERAQPVPADVWIDTSSDVEIIEHSIGSREHGTTLSMLWIPEAVGARLGMP